MDEHKHILVNARKWAKKGLDNAPLARYYQRYTDIESDVTFEQFIALIHETETGNVIDISRYRVQEVKPAMNIEVLMNLLEEEYSRKNPAMG